jgi:hypothetical protein
MKLRIFWKNRYFSLRRLLADIVVLDDYHVWFATKRNILVSENYAYTEIEIENSIAPSV